MDEKAADKKILVRSRCTPDPEKVPVYKRKKVSWEHEDPTVTITVTFDNGSSPFCRGSFTALPRHGAVRLFTIRVGPFPTHPCWRCLRVNWRSLHRRTSRSMQICES